MLSLYAIYTVGFSLVSSHGNRKEIQTAAPAALENLYNMETSGYE